ncbi:MAG: hypothetical protein M3159_02050 [Actinomycetota bacterium]|nr:hypothetical protein [Actinomycetota bacterium]
MRTEVSCRVGVVGAELRVLVLAADTRGCVGVDLDSGAFVRASYSATPEDLFSSFDLISGRIAPSSQPPDASRPETVELEETPIRCGRLSERKAERYIDPLLHPRRGPLLGFAGRAVPYWTLAGDRPSVTMVDIATGPQLRRDAGGYECRFAWQGGRHQYALGDRHLAAQLEDVSWPRFSGRDLQRLLGYRVRRLLVVLTPPHEGYCYKVVAALLPGS